MSGNEPLSFDQFISKIPEMDKHEVAYFLKKTKQWKQQTVETFDEVLAMLQDRKDILQGKKIEMPEEIRNALNER